jgi:hypothetical protein
LHLLHDDSLDDSGKNRKNKMKDLEMGEDDERSER